MATAISAGVQAARFELDLLSTPFHGRSLLTDHAPSTSSRLSCQSRKQSGVARAYVGAPNTGVGAYHTLGLNQSASEDDIKKAYRRLAKQYHPDVCKGESCTVKFMQISDAYETIMDFVQGSGDSLQDIAVNYHPEGMMGVNDSSWEDWEEWMGWEGAGTLDYTSFINDAL